MNLVPTAGGSLLLRIDPRGMFTNVDFAALHEETKDPPRYRFRDDDGDQPSLNLYRRMQAREGVYAFEWIDR